jgi:hypothetical protein
VLDVGIVRSVVVAAFGVFWGSIFGQTPNDEYIAIQSEFQLYFLFDGTVE